MTRAEHIDIPPVQNEHRQGLVDTVAERVRTLMAYEVEVMPESLRNDPMDEETWREARVEHPTERYRQGVRKAYKS